MNSEPHNVQKQASAIAHVFFWSVAGRHQACVEQLHDISGVVPNEVWLSLCFVPFLFGLSFFGEYAGKRYTAVEQETIHGGVGDCNSLVTSYRYLRPQGCQFRSAPNTATGPKPTGCPKPMDFSEGA
jgi:hypothetical protein